MSQDKDGGGQTMETEYRYRQAAKYPDGANKKNIYDMCMVVYVIMFQQNQKFENNSG